MQPRPVINRPWRRVANSPVNFERLKIGYKSLRWRSGVIRIERIGPRSGCTKSRWKLSRNSVALMIAVPRSHLFHKQFPARSDRLFLSRPSGFRGATQAGLREHANVGSLKFSPPIGRASVGEAAEWGTSMQKVIAYQDRAEEWRRRASEATKAQERDADERMAAVWDSPARMREKQLKEGTTQPVF